jgi:hypothetical protein
VDGGAGRGARLGDPALISAEDFAGRHTSFWRATTPLLDGLIRTLNSHPRRYAPRLQSDRWSHRRAFIAEVAFADFRSGRVGEPKRSLGVERQARERVGALVGREPRSLGLLLPAERQEAQQLTSRIAQFANRRARGQAVLVDPQFPGCGVLSPAEGDLLLGHILYEVKAVSRTFRAIDIRQLLVYAALDFARPIHRVARVGLVNPLQGVWEEWGLDDVCLTIAGLPASEVFNRIIAYISSDLDAGFEE